MTQASLFPPLLDDQLTGVIMWLPGGLFDLVVGPGLFAVGIAGSREERMVASDERPW